MYQLNVLIKECSAIFTQILNFLRPLTQTLSVQNRLYGILEIGVHTRHRVFVAYENPGPL